MAERSSCLFQQNILRFLGECGQQTNGLDENNHFPLLDLHHQPTPSLQHRYQAQQPPQTIQPPIPKLSQLQLQQQQQQLEQMLFLPPCLLSLTPQPQAHVHAPQYQQHQPHVRNGTAVEPGRDGGVALPLSHQSQTIYGQDKSNHQPQNGGEQKRQKDKKTKKQKGEKNKTKSNSLSPIAPKSVRLKSSVRSKLKSISSGWESKAHVQRACQFVWNVENHDYIESMTSEAQLMSFLQSDDFHKNRMHWRLKLGTIEAQVRTCNGGRFFHWNNGEMWVRACYSGAKLRLDVACSSYPVAIYKPI